MKVLYFIWCVIFLFFSCTATHSNEGKESLDGATLFKKYCVTCHGIKGDLGANGAFNLSSSQLNMDEKIKVIVEGRKNMPSFKGLLNEAEIKTLAEYIIKFKKQ